MLKLFSLKTTRFLENLSLDSLIRFLIKKTCNSVEELYRIVDFRNDFMQFLLAYTSHKLSGGCFCLFDHNYATWKIFLSLVIIVFQKIVENFLFKDSSNIMNEEKNYLQFEKYLSFTPSRSSLSKYHNVTAKLNHK